MNDDCVIFRYYGKYAHFLKAEANVSAPSYPVPPRTVLLGLAGAVLGLKKDQPQVELAEAKFAVSGSCEGTHWHTAKFHQTLPASIPLEVTKNSKGSSSEKKQPKMIAQEWLFKPSYTIWAVLPEKWNGDFASRIKERRWNFAPSLGLSEMTAQLEFIDSFPAIPIKEERELRVETVFKVSEATVLLDQITEKLMIKSLSMPRDVTPDRVFSHEKYMLETSGRKVPIKTRAAWQVGEHYVTWL